MNGWTWGLLLDGVWGVGSWRLGSKRRSGWLIVLVAQVLWAAYAVTTAQWGFFPGIAFATFLAARGWIKWKGDE